MSHAGRFVWRELVTPAPAQTAGFYGKLFGWSSKAVDIGAPVPYTMLHHDGLDEDVGGAITPAMDEVPPHWLDYITVDDVDAAVAKVPSLGGNVVVAARDLPVGRFAIVQDPAGATLALFKSQTPGASDTDRRPPDHTFCWSTLMVDDVDAVAPFYAALFGWTPVAQDFGAVWFMDGETPRASAMTRPSDAGGSNHWLTYVAVPDTDAALAQAEALGATVLQAPTDLPGMGRFAVLGDPSGAAFALWTDANR